MRLIRGFGLFLFIAWTLCACFTPPEYPIQPQIEFESVVYREYGTGFDSNADSLILTIKFKDGDGDLGLDPSEISPPYNNKYYYRFSNGKYLNYADKRTNPNYDTLPDFVKPFNCINWEVIRENNLVKDTLYFELNPNYYNITIDFLVKNFDGSFTEFDLTKEFNYPFCGGTFDGRFPILFKDKPGTPLEGTIRYSMGSPAFKAFFSIKTLKLRIQIKDRALNKSSFIETTEFTL
ncbi:MAG: hypothetical protein JNM78_08540 [Cyclobacteriaceae bacterium]|nr:hypothetical protein [Cyclobacteriaceae bacterium]